MPVARRFCSKLKSYGDPNATDRDSDIDPEQGLPYLRNQSNLRHPDGFVEISAAVLHFGFTISHPHEFFPAGSGKADCETQRSSPSPEQMPYRSDTGIGQEDVPGDLLEFLALHGWKIFKPEVHMRKVQFAWIPAVLLFSGMALGQVSSQNIFPFKDIVFPQVAAGGAYESWITITNRGPEVWNGNVEFYNGEGVPWNPVVNGALIVGGTLRVSINPRDTETYKVTLPGSTEAGYAMFKAHDADLTNFIEGYLTYYISEGGVVTDSVGVLPARQFMVSSLPFMDFNSIALGLVNSDPEERTANLKLTLYSDSGSQLKTEQFRMVEWEYSAQYLWQLFPDVTLGRGRLEIESDVPISGMALTQAPGKQFSSLPLESTTRTYSLEIAGMDAESGSLTLWTESFFVKGYMQVWMEGEVVLFSISGQITNGGLLINFGSVGLDEVLGIIKADGVFTLGQTTFTGTIYVVEPDINDIETGTFTATLVP